MAALLTDFSMHRFARGQVGTIVTIIEELDNKTAGALPGALNAAGRCQFGADGIPQQS
jgi:hypothetical protein